MAKTTVRTPFVIIILAIIIATLAAPARQAAAQTTCVVYNTMLASPSGYIVGTLSSDLEADLRTAMECAEANNTNDRIDFGGQTVTLDDAPAAYDDYGHNGLPKISTNLLLANGTIERSSTTGACNGGDGDREQFRLLLIGSSGNVTLTNMTLRNGCASDVDSSSDETEFGGGSLNLGTLRLNAVHLENNVGDYGGAIWNQGIAYIANSSFANNYSSGTGAAIASADDGYTLIANSTLYQNSAAGAIVVVQQEAEIHLVNSTLTENSAGEILRQGSTAIIANRPHTFYNVILANNDANNNCNPGIINSTVIMATGSYSDDASCDFANKGGTDNATLPLGAAQTAANGTVYYPINGGDALDGGNSSLLPTEADLGIDVDQDGTIENSTISIDQRGGPRDEGSSVDAGAFEFSCAAYLADLASANGYLVGTIFADLELDLRQAMGCANSQQGDERIELGGQTVTLDDAPAAYDSPLFGYNGLPRLAPGTITIENGVIERDSSLVCDGGQGDRTEFRLFFVQASAELVLENVTLRHGCAQDVQASPFDEDGGAIFNQGTVRLNAVHLEQNEASAGGAIHNEGELVVANSSFVGNNGRFAGGVVSQSSTGASSTLLNTTISGNNSVNSLLLIGADTTLTLLNSTIAHNSGSGQALVVDGTADSHSLYNTILSNNEMVNCNGNVSANTTAADHSYSDDGSCGFTSNGGADNSSHTLAGLTTAVNGTQYQALLGGTAVNGGQNNLLPAESDLGLDVDQDGTIETTRVNVDQQLNGRIVGSAVDAGAVEVRCNGYNSGFNSADGYQLGTVLTADLAADLRLAIECANNKNSDDLIDLGGQTVILTDAPSAYAQDGANGLEPIEDNGLLTVQNGRIERDSSYTSCNGSFPDFRLFYIETAAALVLESVTLQNGCAAGSNQAGQGAAIFNAGTLNAATSTFRDNTASEGGALYNRQEILNNSPAGVATITQSLFSNNSASDGGAIANLGDLTVTNTTLSGNSATRGAGIYHVGADTTVNYSTVVDNTASEGAGLFVNDGPLTLNGTLIASNNGADCYSDTSEANGGFNLIEATGSAACNLVDGVNNNLIGVDPQLGVLADNGGPTESHLVLGGSPALNHIPADSCGTTVDQRGEPRPQDNACEIGAVEVSCADMGYIFPYTLGSVSSDLAADLRQAIVCANGVNSDDQIDLNGQTVTLDSAPATYDEEGFNGLPVIADNGTLAIANGQIERDSSLTTCNGGNGDRSNFRLLFVDYTANLTLQNIVLQNGCAHNVMSGTTFDRYGGAIHNRGNVWLNAVHLGNNSAGIGGAIYNEATLIVANSSFVGNTLNGSDLGGLGAVLAQFASAEATFVNSTMGQNGAASQTIVQIQNGRLVLVNSTLAENIADSVIAFSTTAATDGTHSIHNTLLANNTANSNCNGNIVNAANISTSHSLSDDNSCSFDTSGGTDAASVTLGSLTTAANGTQYYLLAGGDGLDGGNDSLLPTEAALGIDVDQDGSVENVAIEIDQRGGERIEGTAVDAGAVETSLSLIVSSLDDVEDGDYSFGELTLREAVALASGGTTITFDASLSGGTIVLNQTLTIAKELTISGNVPITISGNDSLRVLEVTAGEVTLDSLSLIAGRTNSNGAGLYVHTGATAHLIDSTIAHNRAAQGLVVGIFNEGTMTITGSTISDNVTENSTVVGGIWNAGSMDIENSTLSGNSGQHIGGIYNIGQMTLLHVTVANNAHGSGTTEIGGIANGDDLTITNSISADNTGADCGNPASGAVVTDGGHNLIEVDDAANPCGLVQGVNGNLVGIDPQLGVLTNNGSTTETHALASTSPAVDVIATCTVAVDQRGVTRPQGDGCDMGAFERATVGVRPPTLTFYADGSFAWTPDHSSCTESLYRSTTPYVGHTWLTDDPSNYDGSASLTDPDVNYFYYLQVDCSGGMATSNEVGEFTFAIVPGG